MELEYRVVDRDGGVVWVRDESVMIWDKSQQTQFRQGVMLDTIERKRLEEELRHQAFHDSLTGLPNRALFMDRLGHAIERTRHGGGASGILETVFSI